MIFETGHDLGRTRTLFLRILSLCYAIAFLSLYTQVEGLYGSRGVLPVAVDHMSAEEALQDTGKLSLLWIGNRLGISGHETLELLCLAGTLLGIAATVSPAFASKPAFFVLWLSYLSAFRVGQTFLWFQWDILLLEVGFLGVIVSPTFGDRRPRPRDHVCMMLVRWLLFRMMFASGVVKLQSGCPRWWGLTAMPLHYESQCIPTYLSWFAYNVDSPTLHKLSVVVTFVTEIPLSLLFFAPTNFLRKFTLFFQILLMASIMLTGNYNFFNLLYVGLCVSLIDDSDFEGEAKNRSGGCCSGIVNGAAVAYLTAASVWTFYGFSISSTRLDFDAFVTTSTKVGVASGAAALVFSFLISLKKTFDQDCGTAMKSLVSLLGHTVVVLVCFFVSLPVFLRGIDQQGLLRQFPKLAGNPLATSLHHHANQLNLVHSYGLFRSMTGAGGRPEIVIEGAASSSGPWEEFHFLYKPGNVSEPLLPFVLPHQPRLDWQMWFAALGDHRHNPWLVSLVYRLLRGEESVRRLLDEEKNPFKSEPPAFVRITAYKYHFTKVGSSDWWRRDGRREYLSPVGLRESGLEEYLEATGISIDAGESRDAENRALAGVRNFLKAYPPHTLVQSVAVATIAVAAMI